MSGDNPWIEWKGGECPVAPDMLVKVRFACDHSASAADNYPARPAKFWSLAWRRRRVNNRIIAYRLVSE